MKRYLTLIHAIHTIDKPDTQQLADATGMAQSSVKRLIAELRRDGKMQIEHIRVKGAHGRVGYFKISDWGIFNPSRLFDEQK